MEIIVTIAYFFLIRLIFFDYKLMKFNLFWKFIVFGLYATAALTEIVLLGQYTPYSKEAFVQSRVVPIAPEWGGKVVEVFAKPMVPLKKGDPLFRMDETTFKEKVDELQAQVAAAETTVAQLNQQVQAAKANVQKAQEDLKVAQEEYNQIAKAAQQNAVAGIRLEQSTAHVSSLQAELRANQAALQQAQLAYDSQSGDEHTAIAQAKAGLAVHQNYLDNTTVLAPSNGFVVNLQLHSGAFVRMKTPLLSFVSSDDQWIVAKALQQSLQHTRPGDDAEVLFKLYPGRVFEAEVAHVLWASGNAQLPPSGVLPKEEQLRPAEHFFLVLRLKEDHPEHPLRFGAQVSVAVYTSGAPAVFKFVRQLEIRSESWLNYVFNPF